MTIDDIGHPVGVYSGTHIFLKTFVAVHSTLLGYPSLRVLYGASSVWQPMSPNAPVPYSQNPLQSKGCKPGE